MATQSRGTDPSLEEMLFEEGYRFDFFQAVRVLERLYPERGPVGTDTLPDREVVRFHVHQSLLFPPSAVHEISARDDHKPADMTVALMGLTGSLGVLPRHYTELLLARIRYKDHVLREFLDLFNHRLISLFYRAWEKYRHWIGYERAASTPDIPDDFSVHLFDLIGMGTLGLRGRLDVKDRALMFYTGLLANHPRSASALEGLLQAYFEVPVQVIQFTGEWLVLPEESRSRLSSVSANNELGVSAMAGSQVWDQQAKFKIRAGPLDYRQFCDFHPSGSAFRPLVQLSRFFAGQEFDFDIELVLRASAVPDCVIGETSGIAPRLGWSTWLKTREFTRDADDCVLTGAATMRGAIAA